MTHHKLLLPISIIKKCTTYFRPININFALLDYYSREKFEPKKDGLYTKQCASLHFIMRITNTTCSVLHYIGTYICNYIVHGRRKLSICYKIAVATQSKYLNSKIHLDNFNAILSIRFFPEFDCEFPKLPSSMYIFICKYVCVCKEYIL